MSRWLITALIAGLLCPALPAQGDPPGEKKGSGTTTQKSQDPEKKKQKQDPGEEKKKGEKKQDPEKGKDPEPPPEEEIPIPAGADPADIKAIRSAQDMIRAERQLQRMIKEGKIKGLDKVLTFDELSSWPYEDGLKGMPERILELDGKKVLMTGFMLPIDEVENIKEFLLVQSLWSCCYGQPPDINGIVRVVMPKDDPADYSFDPLKIVGTFEVEATVLDGYCVDIYQLHVESMEPIRPGKPSGDGEPEK